MNEWPHWYKRKNMRERACVCCVFVCMLLQMFPFKCTCWLCVWVHVSWCVSVFVCLLYVFVSVWVYVYVCVIIIIIHPLTARVVGAPQMILQPVFSIFLVLHCPLGPAELLACPNPSSMHVCLHTLYYMHMLQITILSVCVYQQHM